MRTYELLEWRDRRYRHVRYYKGTPERAREVIARLNEGYTGPRFILREV